jgi:EAL domain-containing protein (putative c-di-GMP-specific phosphodiesterase class I)
VDDQEIFTTLRIGAAVYPQDGHDGDILMQKAAIARQATGLGAVAFFSAKLDAELRERRAIERELRTAIPRGELVLLYQPVVDLWTRKVTGAEALIRWRSESLGDVPPPTFIRVAEETGLIHEIGEWVLVTACRQGREWSRRGFPRLRISVNASVKQLREPAFLERLEAILGEAGPDSPDLRLGMEITETVLMENVEDAVAVIRRLRGMGVKTYIDDFGTGYSSLSYLRDLPLDTLKIDTSFVRDIPGDEDAVAVVTGILAMAHSLELRVIAEGVETEEQFITLRNLGCEAAQGYYFSRPIPADEFEQILEGASALGAGS